MDLNKMSKEQKQYLFLGVLVLVAILYGLSMLVGRLVRSEKETRADFAELTERVERAERSLRGEFVLRQNIEEAGRELDEMLCFMPEYGNEFIWATERVYELIRDSGLDLKSVDKLDMLKPKSESLLGSYSVRISATGGYNDVRVFLKKIEEANPFISILNLEISANSALSMSEHKLGIDLSWPMLFEKKGGNK